MWITILSGLNGLLGNFLSNRTLSSEQKDRALAAIMEAANETKLYMKRIQSKEERNREIEEKLSRLWSAASVPIRHFDQDLSERCLTKSDYWLNPDKYSAADIEKFRIGLEEVYEEAKALMN